MILYDWFKEGTENNGIATHHPELKARMRQIMRCKDALEGTDAIKDRQTEYLPKLGNQEDAEYLAYQLRASFLGVTERTSAVMIGSLMRKPAKVEIPDKLKYLLEDATGYGESFEDFIRKAIGSLLWSGRTGIVCDRIKDTNKLYFTHYSSERITDWDLEVAPGQPKRLVRVVLKETYLERTGFTKEIKERYREYILKNNICVVNFWEEDLTTTEPSKTLNAHSMTGTVERAFKIKKTVTLTRLGKPLDYIPVSFVSAGIYDGYSAVKPPLLDVADINLSHYRTSADLEHGRHWTALPTPWFSGLADDSPVVIGSGKAMIMPDPQASAGFLEFTGTGLRALDDARKEKEEQMAYLGARMLMDKSSGSENAEVVRMNTNGETAVLVDLARGLSKGLTRAFKQAAMWEGLPVENIKITLNTDYVNAVLSPGEFQALTVAYQSGALSIETYLERLQKGEIIGEDVNLEDEKERIELAGEGNLMEELSKMNFGNPDAPKPEDKIKDAEDGAKDIKKKAEIKKPDNRVK